MMATKRDQDQRLQLLNRMLLVAEQNNDKLSRRLFRVMGDLRRLYQHRRRLLKRIAQREAELRSQAAQRAHETLRRRKMEGEPAGEVMNGG